MSGPLGFRWRCKCSTCAAECGAYLRAHDLTFRLAVVQALFGWADAGEWEGGR